MKLLLLFSLISGCSCHFQFESKPSKKEKSEEELCQEKCSKLGKDFGAFMNIKGECSCVPDSIWKD